MIERPDTSLLVKEISCPRSFHGLQDKWRDLEESVSHPSVFLTHEWFSSAWQWRCQDSALLILVVWQNGELVGACPLIKSQQERMHVKYTKLEYLAVPDTQECLILAEPSLEPQVHLAILNHLNSRKDWDIAEIRQIPEDSFSWKFLTSEIQDPQIAIGFGGGGSNPTVPLAGTWQDYYSRRSRRLKKGNNHIANKLKRRYSEISVEFHYYSKWPDGLLQAVHENLIDLSIRSWKSMETKSSFDHDGPKAWLGDISSVAADEGWLAVWILRLDEQCAATEMQLIRNGIASALRADFDNELRDLSPGAYLNWKILEHLFSQDSEGVHEYRMGPGANPYKARWSEQELQLGHAVLYNKTLVARTHWIIEKWIKPTLRKIANLLSRQH